MSAAISSDKLCAIVILGGAVEHKLGPAVRCHRPEGDLERQIPHNFLLGAFYRGSLETVLTGTCLGSSRQIPVSPHDKVVANGKTIKFKEFSKINLAIYGDVKVTEWLGLWIEFLCILVVFVHVFILELLSIILVVFNIIDSLAHLPHIVLFKIYHLLLNLN